MNQPFKGTKWVFTGSLESMTRDRARELVMSLGGEVVGAVTVDVFAVVAGPGAGSKERVAHELGKGVWSETDFLQVLRRNRVGVEDIPPSQPTLFTGDFTRLEQRVSDQLADHSRPISSAPAFERPGEKLTVTGRRPSEPEMQSLPALKRQVGGDHYAKRGIQPVQFAMQNRWDACAFSVLKYLTRHREKNGKQDLEKARHFVELRVATLLGFAPSIIHITMDEYVAANGITAWDAVALEHLNHWVSFNNDRSRLSLLTALDHLINEYA